jgi:DNA ligase-1
VYKNAIQVFKQIQSTSSRTDKEAILKANKDSFLFRQILEFMYNPFILTGIKEKKLQKFASHHDENNVQFTDVLEAISYITKNNSGRDEDVKAIASFINNHTEAEIHDFLQDMFTKDFKCGLSASTINKVYGKGTIPEFDVLLAKSYKDHGHKIKGKFYVTLKLDGIRCVAIKKNRAIQFFTRQGQPIDDLVEIEQELMNRFPDNFVYDGELLLAPNGMISADLFRATQKVVRKDGIKKGLEFHMFDLIPVDEFMAGKSKNKYEQRRENLSDMFIEAKPNFCMYVPILYVGEDKGIIPTFLQEVVMLGHEGLMVNIANGHYVTRRSDVLLKVKEMHTIDLRITGVERGSGKYKDTLGALIVDYKGYEVKVGSGYTEEERVELWEMGLFGDLIDRVIEVQYFEESSNQDGGISLRFPVFKALREEGKEVSYH